MQIIFAQKMFHLNISNLIVLYITIIAFTASVLLTTCSN